MKRPLHFAGPIFGLAAMLLAWSAHGNHAAAAPKSPPRAQCCRPADINGWRAAGEQTVYVRIGVKRIFRMQLFAPCPDIDWSERIGIEARGSPWICSGLDATIVSPSPIGPHRCPVTRLVELTPAEIAALPKKNLP